MSEDRPVVAGQFRVFGFELLPLFDGLLPPPNRFRIPLVHLLPAAWTFGLGWPRISPAMEPNGSRSAPGLGLAGWAGWVLRMHRSQSRFEEVTLGAEEIVENHW